MHDGIDLRCMGLSLTEPGGQLGLDQLSLGIVEVAADQSAELPAHLGVGADNAFRLAVAIEHGVSCLLQLGADIALARGYAACYANEQQGGCGTLQGVSRFRLHSRECLQ